MVQQKKEGFISKITSLFSKKNDSSNTKELVMPFASSGDVRLLASVKGEDLGKPLGTKEESKTGRITYDCLETAYLTDATIFNGINKIVQTIMLAGYRLECSNERIKQNYLKFLNNIGNIGSDLTFDELLSRIFQDQCIYGESLVEMIYNINQSKIIDLDILDAKRMDYARKSNQIALNEYGKPIGFTQKVPNAAFGRFNGDPWPKEISAEGGKIFLKPERIAHFKLFTFGDGLKPIGLIEPSYNQIVWKLNIEKGLANSIYMSGFPIRVVYVGDKEHEANLEQIEYYTDKLKDLSYKQNLGLPNYVKLELMESTHPEKMQDNLNYFREQEITSLGIPKPFATGGGEETNRATLTNQERMFRLTLKDIMRRTAGVIEKQIFKKIAELENYSVIPRLVFNEIEETAEIERADILIKAVQAGIMAPDEVKVEFLKIMEFGNEPETEKETKK